MFKTLQYFCHLLNKHDLTKVHISLKAQDAGELANQVLYKLVQVS